MDIRLNDEVIRLNTDLITVQQLLDLNELTAKKGLAVAVNNSVVPRISWNEFTIRENDHILIITATQGG